MQQLLSPVAAPPAAIDMASHWQPADEGVAQVVALLQEFHRPGASQAEAYAQLDRAKDHVDFRQEWEMRVGGIKPNLSK